MIPEKVRDTHYCYAFTSVGIEEERVETYDGTLVMTIKTFTAVCVDCGKVRIKVLQ